jgi:hypothetical protein
MALSTPLSVSTQVLAQMASATEAAASPMTPGLLSKDVLAPLIPASVFFADKVAPTQARNAAGVRLADGKLMLSMLVDTSGYSTGIQEKYQAYLITEGALSIGGHTLPAGAYGFGFIGGDRFIVMDIGGKELFTTSSTRDTELRRPTPLQIVAQGAEYRLYAGRTFVTFHAAGAAQ